jgi:hypothetical protein
MPAITEMKQGDRWMKQASGRKNGKEYHENMGAQLSHEQCFSMYKKKF